MHLVPNAALKMRMNVSKCINIRMQKYTNAYKCNNMQYQAAGEECNWMKCNENDENASECIDMHWNAYVKKQHHFR